MLSKIDKIILYTSISNIIFTILPFSITFLELNHLKFIKNIYTTFNIEFFFFSFSIILAIIIVPFGCFILFWTLLKKIKQLKTKKDYLIFILNIFILLIYAIIAYILKVIFDIV